MDRRVALTTRMLSGACARIRQRARKKLGMRQDLARTTLLLAFGTLGSIFLHGVVEGSYEAGRGRYGFPKLALKSSTTQMYLKKGSTPKLENVAIGIKSDSDEGYTYLYDADGNNQDPKDYELVNAGSELFWQTELLKGHGKSFVTGEADMQLQNQISKTREDTDLRAVFSSYMKERPLSTALATGWGQLRDGGFLFVAAFVLLYVFKHTCLRVHLGSGDRVRVTGRGVTGKGEILFNGSRHPVAVQGRGKLRKGEARVVSATERSCDLRLSDGSTVTVTNPRVYRTPRPRRLAVYLVAANMLLLTSQLLVAKKEITAEFKDGTSRTLTYERFLMSMVAVATLLTA